MKCSKRGLICKTQKLRVVLTHVTLILKTYNNKNDKRQDEKKKQESKEKLLYKRTYIRIINKCVY